MLVAKCRSMSKQLGIPAKLNACSEGSRTAFQDDPEHHLSVATPASRGCWRGFGFVKRNLSGAKRRQPRSGHLWQSRFFSSPLSANAMWTVLRYMELNPVRSGLVTRAATGLQPQSTAGLRVPRRFCRWPIGPVFGARNGGKCIGLRAGRAADRSNSRRDRPRLTIRRRIFHCALERRQGRRLPKENCGAAALGGRDPAGDFGTRPPVSIGLGP